MGIASFLIEVDRACDYIPFVSTLSNIVVLFQKCTYYCLPESIAKNRHWTHIHEKEFSRCLTLLVPFVGNICVLLSDYSKIIHSKY